MLRELADLVAPVDCVGCGARRTHLCPRCRAEIAREARRGPHLARVRPPPAGLPPVWTLLAYDGAVRQAVVAHKDHGRLALLPLLAALWRRSLAGAVEGDPVLRAALLDRRVVVVPAPSSARAWRERGRDPWEEVVRHALAGEPLPVARRALRVRRAVRDQAGLGASARARNLAGALVATRDLTGCAVVLADDIVTTGATLTEGARAVRAAGAASVHAAVIASTVRRGRPSG